VSASRFTGWSCEKSLWDRLESLGKDLSWRKVKFYPDNISKVPAKKRGVYLICAYPPVNLLKNIGAYTILYAGQVKSHHRGFQNRFSEHIKGRGTLISSFNKCYYPNLDFWFSCISEDSLIDEIESLIIDVFRPPCNKIRGHSSQYIPALLKNSRRIGLALST